MSKRTYVSSSVGPQTESTWGENYDSSYLLQDEVIKELQDVLKEIKESGGNHDHAE